MAALTHARLRELLHYDPATGVFTWLARRGGAATLGAKAGSVSGSGYIQIGIDGRSYQAHRLAWFYVKGEWPSRGLDHKDMVRSHNRLDNLRPATKSQNNANCGRRSDCTSGFKGVTWKRSRRRWCAQIQANGERRHLGLFDTPQEAHAAYVEAAKELHGEFARGA